MKPSSKSGNNQAKKQQNQQRKKPKFNPTIGRQNQSAAKVKRDQRMYRAVSESHVKGLGRYSEKIPGKPIAKMAFGTSNESMLKVGTNTLTIKTQMEMPVLVEALITYLSSLYFFNIPGAYANGDADIATGVWRSAASGAAYLGQGIYKLSLGANVDISKMPRIFDVLTQLLTSKTVRLGGGIVRYSPTWNEPFEFPEAFATPTGSVWSCVEPGNLDVVTYTYNAVPPSADDYSVLLKLSEQNKEFGSQVVSYTENKGLYTQDPSCYARVYSYFGSGGTASVGCYNEVELEAPFQYPQFARFVKYDLADRVISRIFHPTVGGINTAVGQTLVQPCTYSLLRNPIPAIYKFIDFYQVYTVLCHYMVNVLEQAAISAGTQDYAPQTLPMTQDEFCVALRQAILTQFSSQVHGQFVAPQTGVPTQSVSIFEPFIVDSVTAPSQAFASFLIPQFLQENLCMLKQTYSDITSTPKSDKFKTPPKRLRHNFYPVWGVYSGDVPPVFSFQTPDGPQPLFQPSPPNAPTWRLWDGVSNQNPLQKFNFNSQRFTSAVSAWNDALTRRQNVTSKIGPISGDEGPGVKLLTYTRVVEYKPQGTLEGASRYQSPMYESIVNKPGDRKEGKEAKDKKMRDKKVDAVQPASYFDLYTEAILSHCPLASDYYGAVRYFILPEIRLDAQGTDTLTQAAYAVYTGEVCTVSNTMGTTPSDNEVSRLLLIAQLMTSGLFAASADNNVLTQAAAELLTLEKGSDFIKSLLGGMASLIPGVGGVISNVIQGL